MSPAYACRPSPSASRACSSGTTVRARAKALYRLSELEVVRKVEIVALRQREDGARQVLARPLIVGIEERYVAGTRGKALQAAVSSRARAGVALSNQGHGEPQGTQLPEFAFGRDGRRIVDDDDVNVQSPGLCEHRGKRPCENAPLLLVKGDHHRDANAARVVRGRHYRHGSNRTGSGRSSEPAAGGRRHPESPLA